VLILLQELNISNVRQVTRPLFICTAVDLGMKNEVTASCRDAIIKVWIILPAGYTFMIILVILVIFNMESSEDGVAWIKCSEVKQTTMFVLKSSSLFWWCLTWFMFVPSSPAISGKKSFSTFIIQSIVWRSKHINNVTHNWRYINNITHNSRYINNVTYNSRYINNVTHNLRYIKMFR